MTQEQAQEILATVSGKLEMKRLEAVNLLFKEIDELKMMEEDAQQYVLKCSNELEALRTKNCDGCKYEHKDAYSLPCAACVRNCDSDYYEPKEQ